MLYLQKVTYSVFSIHDPLPSHKNLEKHLMKEFSITDKRAAFGPISAAINSILQGNQERKHNRKNSKQ